MKKNNQKCGVQAPVNRAAGRAMFRFDLLDDLPPRSALANHFAKSFNASAVFVEGRSGQNPGLIQRDWGDKCVLHDFSSDRTYPI